MTRNSLRIKARTRIVSNPVGCPVTDGDGNKIGVVVGASIYRDNPYMEMDLKITDRKARDKFTRAIVKGLKI